MKKAIQFTWLLSGILACVVFALAINIGLDARATMKDARELWTQVTIDDIRQGLDIIEKQIDNDALALQIEQRLSIAPLDFTLENWQAFLDFCGQTGYVVSDENWQRFKYGKLKP